MELPAPQQSMPVVLLLDPRTEEPPGLASLCREAGVLLDHARTRPDALRMFSERGGHDALLCSLELTDELRSVPEGLLAVDPQLPILSLSEFEDRLRAGQCIR